MAIITRSATRPKLIDVDAIESTQGGRRVYTFTLTCRELDHKIELRTRPEVIQEANRKYDAKHAGDIQQYLHTTDNWVLGAELLAIDRKAIHFEPYPEEETGEPSPVGRLVIYEEDKHDLRLFDGQHRRGAIASLIRDDFAITLQSLQTELVGLRSDLEGSEDTAATREGIVQLEGEIEEVEGKLKRFLNDSLTFILYGEGELEAVQQMFSDAANAKPQERITRARFDRRNAFNLAADEIWSSSEILKGRVDMERDQVSQTSEHLLSFNQLADILKTLQFGYYGRVSRSRNAELLTDFAEVVAHGIEFFDEFLPAAMEEFDLLLSQERTSEDIPDVRQNSFACNVTILKVLAGCFREWGVHNWQPLAEYLRVQRFDKGRQRGAVLVQAGLVAPGGNTPQARRQEVQGAIRYIVDATRKYHESQQAV